MLTIVLSVLAIVGFAFGSACGYQLWRWERQLRGARISVTYKGKTKMTPRLLDWLLWANKLEGDKRVNGQVIYQMGGTTIALRKPLPRSHGKTKTRTIKEPTA